MDGLWGYRLIKRVFIPRSYKMILAVKAVSLEVGTMLTLDSSVFLCLVLELKL